MQAFIKKDLRGGLEWKSLADFFRFIMMVEHVDANALELLTVSYEEWLINHH